MKSLNRVLVLLTAFFVGWWLAFSIPQIGDVKANVNDEVLNEEQEGVKVKESGQDESVKVGEKAGFEIEHRTVTVEIQLPQVISRVDCFPSEMPSE